MRIIAGTAKGRKILSPKNEGRITVKGDLHATRPTLDRVKENMFNIIGHKVYGAKVLDMFAGTGSLGLESASRGAREVVFLERFQETYGILRQNIETLGFSGVSRTYARDSYEFIKSLGVGAEKFDIIFVDPPYLNHMVDEAIKLIESRDLLTPQGVIVTKYDSEEPVYLPHGIYELVDQRKYGKTVLAFYQMKVEE